MQRPAVVVLALGGDPSRALDDSVTSLVEAGVTVRGRGLSQRV